MKAKISRGKGFRGVLDYVKGKGEAERIAGNLSGETVREMAREMGVSRKAREDIEKPVWHCSLSLTEGEHVSKDQWECLCTAYLARMGVDPESHQWVAYQHHDTGHEHVHIVVNRIDTRARVWDRKNDVYKAIRTCQEMEKDFGLVQTPGMENKEFGSANLKRSEVEKAIREQEAPVKIVVAEAIKKATVDNPDINVFVERLRDAGVQARPNVAKTGRMNGFSFTLPGRLDKVGKPIAVKASQVGASWKTLKERVRYELERDSGFLFRVKDAGDPFWDSLSGRGEEVTGVDRDHSGQHGESERPSQDTDRDSTGRSREENQHSFEAGEASRNGNVKGAEGDIQHTQGDTGRTGKTEMETHDPDVVGLGRDNAWNGLSDAVTSLSMDTGIADESDSEDRVMSTKSVKYKQQVWLRQANALSAPGYRITLRDRTGKEMAWNLGKGKGENGEERVWTAEEISEKMAFLEAKNIRKNDIYVTPIDPDNHYILLDDLHAEGLERLKEHGYQPCWVALSSQDNFQAIIKVPAEEKTKDEQSSANYLMRSLNEIYGGDKSITAVIHPFRMAGFNNKKQGRNNVQTKIVTASPCLCQKTIQELEEVRKNMAIMKVEKEKEVRIKAIENVEDIAFPRPEGETSLDKKYRRKFKMWQGLVKKQGWNEDLSALDFRTCKSLIEDGHSDKDVAMAMFNCSPRITGRHESTDDYIGRTLRAVHTRIEQEEAKKDKQIER